MPGSWVLAVGLMPLVVGCNGCPNLRSSVLESPDVGSELRDVRVLRGCL